MKKILGKDDILTAVDLKVEEIEVPEWGGTVRVSQITAADRLALQMMILDEKTQKPKSPLEITRLMTIGLLTLAIVDEQGNRLFTPDDVEALGKKSSAAVDRVFEAADKLNGISAEMAGVIKKN